MDDPSPPSPPSLSESPPLPGKLGQEAPRFRRPPPLVWLGAFVISLTLPFIVLRWARCIGTGTMIVGIIAGLTAHLGLVTVLAELEGNPLQVFVVLLMGACLYIIGLWQYLLGQRVGYWSDAARAIWRGFGKFLGGFILFALILNITSFHVVRWAERLQEQRLRQQPVMEGTKAPR